MARIVTLTVTYDMDDTEKSLEAEFADWKAGRVDLQDVLACGGTVTVVEGTVVPAPTAYDRLAASLEAYDRFERNLPAG